MTQNFGNDVVENNKVLEKITVTQICELFMRVWISSDFLIPSREFAKIALQLCEKATS
ncbi:MAG: hypothetical protein IKY94_06325 [Lachnospiraceae bacterium]|nr:hypothetical protein [Lachnospiraceae bacterium]